MRTVSNCAVEFKQSLILNDIWLHSRFYYLVFVQICGYMVWLFVYFHFVHF